MSKIAIPECFHVETSQEKLESKTSDYWWLSRVWNEQMISNMNVGDAIHAASDIVRGVEQTKRLYILANGMRNDIISHGTKRRMIKACQNNDNKQAAVVLL